MIDQGDVDIAMTTERVDREPVVPAEQDVDLIKDLEQFLHENSAPRQDSALRPAQLVAPSGEKMDIPEPIYEALRRIVPLMAQGAAIGLIPLHKELTTQQAADLLNVSRPFLIKLLDEGAIPYTRPGKHRRVRFSDVMSYKHCRDTERRAFLNRLIALGEDLGDYD